MEEDNDDDELLMREIDELARMNNDDEQVSEGGNTSINSLMEETPSKYDFENGRYHAE